MKHVCSAIVRYLRIIRLRGLVLGVVGTVLGRSFLLHVRHPLARHPCVIRCPSSDVRAFVQVFVRREYDMEACRDPRVIVDAGANVGLASIYFATRFPDARIIAIEPEDSNVAVLRHNVRDYPNVTVFHGALWGHDAQLRVVDTRLGKWGFMTESVDDQPSHGSRVTQETSGISMPTLLERYGIERVDILKIDIEGAEKEVFAECAAWIGRVDAVIVELHDRMKPGCSDSFDAGTTGFDLRWHRGENEFLARRGACIAAATD